VKSDSRVPHAEVTRVKQEFSRNWKMYLESVSAAETEVNKPNWLFTKAGLSSSNNFRSLKQSPSVQSVLNEPRSCSGAKSPNVDCEHQEIEMISKARISLGRLKRANSDGNSLWKMKTTLKIKSKTKQSRGNFYFLIYWFFVLPLYSN